MTTTQATHSPDQSSQSIGFLHQVDLARLSERLNQPPYHQLWAYTQQRAKETMRSQLQSHFQERYAALAWNSDTPMLNEAALLVRLKQDEEALAYILACLDHVAEHQPEKYLDHLLHSWSELAIACDMVRGQLPVPAQEKLCRLMREVVMPYSNPDPRTISHLGNNMSFARRAQVAVCALLWGQQAGVENWREYVDQGIRQLQGYLTFGCDAQGYSFEGTGYGQAVMRLMYPFVELLKITGYADLYTSEAGLKRNVQAVLHSLLPDQQYLTTDNDLGLAVNVSLSYLLLTYRAWQDPIHLSLWYAYQGPEHRLRPWGDFIPYERALAGPTIHTLALHESNLFLACLYWDASAPYTPLEAINQPTSQFSAGVGKAMLRTSWSKEATFFQLLGGGRSNMSQTHRHADAGHFSIFTHGEYLAIDTGRYNSDEDQHSVPLINGQCFEPVAPKWGMDFREGRLESFIQQPPLTYCVADMAAIKNCYWAKRHFLAITPPADMQTSTDEAYLVCVDDLNFNNAPFDLWWQLQARWDATIEIPHATIPGAPVRPLPPQANQQEDGWKVNGNAGVEAGVAHAIVHGQRARLDIHFVSPMTPEAQGASTPELHLWHDIKAWHLESNQEPIVGLLAHPLATTSVCRPRLLMKAIQSHGVLLSLISPRRQGEPAWPVATWQTSRQMGIRIDFGSHTDTILAAPSVGWITHPPHPQYPQRSAMTELLWYRQDTQGRIIHQWHLPPVGNN